ncbi:MAG: HupE/UreJ family protein [Cyanobium sp.]|jgi:urease accessory protein
MSLLFPPSSARPLGLAAAAGFGLSLLSALPVQAHGAADAGLLAGASHPLLGLDHLLLLLGVGGVAAYVSSGVLLFALGGALVGALLGSFGGDLPAAEVWAALAVSALGVLLLSLQRSQRSPQLSLVGSVVAAAVAVHALLHGQEASGTLAWWLGAGLASAAVVGATVLVLRRLHSRWTLALAAALSLTGLALAVAPLA